MEDDILDDDLDLLIGEDETPIEDEAPAEPAKPNPQVEAEAQFMNVLKATIEGALDARGVNKPAEKQEEKQEDYHPGFTPEEIVQSTITVSRTLRQAEREIRAEYGNVLNDDDIESIIATLESQPVGTLVKLIKDKSHFGAANMILGSKVKAGQYKPGQSQKTTSRNSVTPIGGNSPREGVGKTNVATTFEKLYGKPRTKGQAERLNGGI